MTYSSKVHVVYIHYLLTEVRKRKKCRVQITHSWSSTPGAVPPSNCCCCRMLSKSSTLCSRFLMWAGRWQFRKHTGCPNTVILALTPPLFPFNDKRKVKQRSDKSNPVYRAFNTKNGWQTSNTRCFFYDVESQNQRTRQPAAALTSKRRRLQ